MGFAGKWKRAHHIAWIVANGEIPEGQFVLHKCDNRKCVRPDHLELGWHDKNLGDMAKRNRSAYGARNNNAKLTPAKVVEIRRLLATGIGACEIARRFEVNSSAICAIRDGRTWKRVIG